MAIETIITQLAEIEKTIQGVKRAYDETPENVSEYPAFINVMNQGTFTFGAQELARSDHHIRAILLIKPRLKADLEIIEAEARPFIKKMRDKIADNLKLNATAEHVSFDDPSYRYGVLIFGGQEWAVIEFFLHIVEKEAITVSV